MLYHTCPDCQANLDPGEKCDCKMNPVIQTSPDAASNGAGRTHMAGR